MLKPLAAGAALLFFFCLANLAAQAANSGSEIPIDGLKGVGINSATMWSANSTENPDLPGSVIAHFKPLDTYGFSHVALVSCVDWLIGMRCKRHHQTKDGIIKMVRTILARTDLHVTLSLKGYEQKKINGKDQSTFQRKLENETETQAAFVGLWKEFATEFQDVPREKLSFALLNEPEFQFPKPTNKKRRAWEQIATRAITEIRKVSADRVIIYEGISKSKFNQRWGKKNPKYSLAVDTIIRPLPFEDIVYGVHSYEPKAFLDQANNRAGHFGRPYTKGHRNMVRRDADRLKKWAGKHNVPVMVTETGCVGYVEKFEGPANPDDCGKYAADLHKHFVQSGIPVVWWALEKERTIYLRKKTDCRPNQKKYCDHWVPLGRNPDPHLFKGLNLNLP